MNGTVLLLALGLLLLVLLVRFLLRPKAGEPGLSDSQERTALAIEISPELTERLFGSEDWDFIRAQGFDRLTRLFVRQRRALALSWMSEIRGQARQLMRWHRMAARSSSQLEPLVELKITTDYLLFQLLWQLVVCGVWLRGPVALQGVVSYVGALCGRLSAAMAKPIATEGRELPRL